MSGVTAVIFDMDGVLVDSKRAHFESWARLATEHGLVPPTEAEFEATFGRTSVDVMTKVDAPRWSAALQTHTAQQLDDRKEQLFRDAMENNFPAMPRVDEVVGALHGSGLALAIGSSGPPMNVQLVQRKLPCGGLFHCIVDASQVSCSKPHPQVFLTAASKLGVPPTKCCVIEDACVGIQAARRAGMFAVGVVGTTTRPELIAAGAHLVVAALGDITPTLIQNLCRVPRRRFPYRPYSLGHRGARSHAPENTLLSFKQALALGCDRVECDIRLTRDNQLVVIHDAAVNRTSNGTGLVVALTLEELLAFDFGSGEKIPTLDQLLELVKPSGKTLHIELKEPGCEEKMVAAISRHGMRAQILVISFFTELLSITRKLDPGIACAALYSGHPPSPSEAQSLGFKEVGCFHNEIDAPYVADAHRHGLLVHCFNPDTPDQVRRAVQIGVDGIGSNKPKMLIDTLDELSKM